MVIVLLYDVLTGGARKSLTKTQISDLFQIGQLVLNDPCKQVEQQEWRTIDDLFPFLKYEATARSLYQPADLHNPHRATLAWSAAICILVILVASLAGYFAFRGGTTASTNAIDATNPRPPVAYAIENPYFHSPRERERATQERLRAAQRAREQTQAARLAQERAEAEKKELELQKAAGRTQLVPLDQSSIVSNVGGSDVKVKVHDNDVTSFDVWINGARRRQISKQKGVSGSRADETLIYSKGRARLYYVAENSGKTNHCLLRVRDE
jgi:hypothetical protein